MLRNNVLVAMAICPLIIEKSCIQEITVNLGLFLDITKWDFKYGVFSLFYVNKYESSEAINHKQLKLPEVNLLRHCFLSSHMLPFDI